MNVFIRNAFEKSPDNADITVFIDVFRASTTLAYLLKNAGAEIIGAENPVIVEKYKTEGYVVVSEVMGGGLDNSPSEAGSVGTGSKLIQKTGNFTAAVFGNFNFTKAISAAFVNIGAVAGYLTANRFESVDIVACGHFAERKQAIEDVSCAKMLRSMLSGERPSQLPYLDAISHKIERRKTGKFPFPAHYWKDLELALQCDAVPIVPLIRKQSSEVIFFSKANS